MPSNVLQISAIISRAVFAMIELVVAVTVVFSWSLPHLRFSFAAWLTLSSVSRFVMYAEREPNSA